jgi:glycosyltransferase involved in cell wall biosynthesis
MRVLHVTTFLQGGAGRNITDLAVAQHRAGHEVHVVADAGGEAGYGSYPEYVDELTACGIPFTTLTSTFKRDLALNTRAAADLRHLLAGWRPDVVHAHATIPAAVARLAGVAGPSPLLNTMHGWGITKTPEQQATDIALLDLADALVVPSVAAAKTLRSAGLRRDGVQVIPYGIAPDVPEPAAGDPLVDVLTRIAGGRRVALCIGTIGERKNQRLLVDALAEDGAGDVAAVFIGDGDGESLKTHARVRGVAERVIAAGHWPAASRYLPFADVLVLPSRNEGLPLAVLEALRAGTPVVAADIPEIAEALDGGRCGHLFPTDDAPALARALRDAAGVSSERRDALRARFSERYTADRMLATYETLYARLMRDSR